MGDVVLYIAVSADGFIARENGQVDWLDAFSLEGEDYGYGALMERTGAIIMGGATYRQVLTFGTWPYGDVPSYIITRGTVENPPVETIYAHDDDVNALLTIIREEIEKDIWLIGGAQINTLFGRVGLIDEIILSVMPVFLGAGVPLFQGDAFQQSLTLESSQVYSNGVVQMTYRPRR